MSEKANEQTQPDPLSPQPTSRPRVNWFLLLGFLIGPALLALIGALAKIDFIAVGSPLIGGGIGGIICGMIMGRRYGKTMLAKIVIGIGSAILFACVSLGISFVGCALGYSSSQ
jgi:hypothetical protein